MKACSISSEIHQTRIHIPNFSLQNCRQIHAQSLLQDDKPGRGMRRPFQVRSMRLDHWSQQT